MKALWAVCLCLLSTVVVAQDYDFAKKIGGNTLYFIILTTGGKDGPTVEVTYPHTEEDPWKGSVRPRGSVAIPEVVTPDRSKDKDADPEDDDTTVYKVVSVNYCAFKGCDRITRLTIPSTVRRVGELAFGGCRRMEYLVCCAQEPPRLDESSFEGIDISIPVRIPAGSYEKYKEAPGWRVFTEMVEF